MGLALFCLALAISLAPLTQALAQATNNKGNDLTLDT